MQLKTSLAIMLVFALLLQGCGRKGPLKLSDAQRSAQQPVAPATLPAK